MDCEFISPQSFLSPVFDFRCRGSLLYGLVLTPVTKKKNYSMILLASLLLAFFSPGILFPQMAVHMSTRTKKEKGKKEAQEKSQGPASGSDQDLEQGSAAVSGDNKGEVGETSEAKVV